MKKTLLILILISTRLLHAQDLAWDHLVSTTSPINPTMNISNVATDGVNYWSGYVSKHRMSYNLRSLGDYTISRYDSNGVVTGQLDIYGNASILDAIAMDGQLYVRIQYYDSLRVSGHPGLQYGSESRQLIGTIDGQMQFRTIADIRDTISAMCVTETRELVLVTKSGFGAGVTLYRYDANQNFLGSKNLSDIGYVSQIRPKVDGSGFIIAGSCSGQVSIDAIHHSNPVFYNQYIISLDSVYKGEWMKSIEDITCQYSIAASTGKVSYMAAGAYTIKDFGGITNDGPNTISEDFFIASLVDSTFTWVQEVPSDTGWYGVTPATAGQVIDLDSEGNIYMIGYLRGRGVVWNDTLTTGVMSHGYDAVIVSYDIDGKLRWVRNFGGEGYELGMGLDVAGVDDLIFSMVVNDTFTVDSTVHPAQFGDTWIARIRPSEVPDGLRMHTGSSTLSIYPNPSHGNLHMMLDAPYWLEGYEIYDVLGLKVKSQHYPKTRVQNIRIEELDLSEGLYFIRLLSEDALLQSSFQIMH